MTAPKNEISDLAIRQFMDAIEGVVDLNPVEVATAAMEEIGGAAEFGRLLARQLKDPDTPAADKRSLSKVLLEIMRDGHAASKDSSPFKDHSLAQLEKMLVGSFARVTDAS